MADIKIKKDKGLEMSIIGGLMNEPSHLGNEWVAKLSPSDFMYEFERIVFIAIKDLEKFKQVIDLTTVNNRLKETGKLEKIGGAYYLTELYTENGVIPAHLPSYAQKLISYAKHNQKMQVLEDVRLGKADISAVDKIANAERGQEYDMSDGGNAKLLAELHSDTMRFNHTNKQWYVWGSQYWEKDKKLKRFSYARDVPRVRQEHSLTIQDNQEKIKIFNYGVRSGDKTKMEAMLQLTSTLPQFATTNEDWDQDDLVFQCRNGVLNLLDGTLMDGEPNFMISQCSGVIYDPMAECPTFDRFLIEIMDGDEELVEYLLMCLGYSMCGLTDEQCMFILNGNGANGKSVLLDLMSHIFGDYLVHTRFDAFLKKYNSTSTHDLARLSKARMVKANESGVGKNLDEERIKEITGGDVVTARFLYCGEFDYRSKIKLWCATNNLPKTDDLSHAFWRRMVVIPFDRQFKGDDRDTNILEKLKRESSGILNRLHQGFKQWATATLKKPPHRVVGAVKEYQAESDVVARWIDMAGVEKNDSYDTITAKVVYRSFTDWHDENESGKPISQIAFGKRMKALGMGSEKIDGTRKYLGLELTNAGL